MKFYFSILIMLFACHPAERQNSKTSDNVLPNHFESVQPEYSNPTTYSDFQYDTTLSINGNFEKELNSTSSIHYRIFDSISFYKNNSFEKCFALNSYYEINFVSAINDSIIKRYKLSTFIEVSDNKKDSTLIYTLSFKGGKKIKAFRYYKRPWPDDGEYILRGFIPQLKCFLVSANSEGGGDYYITLNGEEHLAGGNLSGDEHVITNFNNKRYYFTNYCSEYVGILGFEIGYLANDRFFKVLENKHFCISDGYWLNDSTLNTEVNFGIIPSLYSKKIYVQFITK